MTKTYTHTSSNEGYRPEQSSDSNLAMSAILDIKSDIADIKAISLRSTNQIERIESSIAKIESRQESITRDVLFIKNDGVIKLLKAVFVSVVTASCGGVIIWMLKSALL